MKCLQQNHFLFNDGKKENKTADSSLFGTAGDPKVLENIEICESIGKYN